MKSTAAQPEALADWQRRFTAYIRTPEQAPLPEGLAPERMALYHELFFNNIESALSDAFPLLQRQLGETLWERLLQDFFARHRCQSPYFVRLPAELIGFLTEEGEAYPHWAVELAHYEWTETEISLMEAEMPAGVDPSGDPVAGVPSLSPLARVVSYGHRVHKAVEAQTSTEWNSAPAAVHLLVYRDAHDRVRWLELKPMIARLLTLIDQACGERGRALLEQVAAEFGYPDRQAAAASGVAALEELQQRGVIIGTLLQPEKDETQRNRSRKDTEAQRKNA